jgi:Xaa-Pro aminopeptidase
VVDVYSDEWTQDLTPLILKLTEGKEMAADVPFENWSVVQDALIPIRSQLTSSDIEKYQALGQDAAKAVEKTCRLIKPGQTEHEIASILASQVIEKGIRTQVILVATDDRIYRYRHPIPSGKTLDKHAMIVLCAERHGMVANVTRLVYFGEPPEDMMGNRAKLARINAAFIGSTKPGKVLSEILKDGIEQYRHEGYPDDWKKLHQGGLTGYASREIIATPDTKYKVKLHEAFAWNPSLPGLKAEDTMLLTESGMENLTKTGDWPYISTEFNGAIYQSPDILIKKE